MIRFWQEFEKHVEEMEKPIRLSGEEMRGAKYFAKWLENLEALKQERFEQKCKQVMEKPNGPE